MSTLQGPPPAPGTPGGDKKKIWPLRHPIISGISAAVILIIIIAAVAGGNKKHNTNSVGASTPTTAAPATTQAPATTAAPTTAQPTTTPPTTTPPTTAAPTTTTSSLTPSQQNAIQAAQQYLSLGQGFSRLGLIDQLSSQAGDAYPVADATFAVDSLHVDWNAQAVLSAKNYLKTQPFSCTDLVQQLSSSAGDQFTLAQAQYGAKAAGIC